MQEKESQGKKRLNYTVAALAAALAHRYVAAPKGKSRPPWRRGRKAPGRNPAWRNPTMNMWAMTHSIHIDRMEENGIVYFVADVQLASASQFQTAFGGGEYGGGKEHISSMATKLGAVFAVNADNYGAHEYGVILRNGALYRTATTARHLLIVDANGDLRVRSEREGENPQELGAQLVEEGALQTFEFGPELVRDGALVEFPVDFTVISTRDTPARTAHGHWPVGPAALHHRGGGWAAGRLFQGDDPAGVATGVYVLWRANGLQPGWRRFHGNVAGGEIINQPSGGDERSVSDMIWF